MQLRKILIPLAAVATLGASYRGYGWPGLVGAVSLIVMWLLLHFTRTMQVLKRAAHRPIGFVGSAVMLNAKLGPGMTLLHVVAMTRSLGELRSTKDTQPEQYRWSDAAQSHVDCEFLDGRLNKWALTRPIETDSAGDAPDVSKAP